MELGAQVVHQTRDDTLARLVRAAGIRVRAFPMDAQLAVLHEGARWDAANLSRHRSPAPWVVEAQLGSVVAGDRAGTVSKALAGLPEDRRFLASAWLDQVVGGDCRTLDLQGVVGTRAARRHGPEVLLVDGFTAVVDALAAGLDIRTACPAQTVVWSEAHVEIRGTRPIRARTAVVTVPPSVVLGGRLGFDPPLPEARLDALMPLASNDALAIVVTTTAPARRSTWVLLADPPGGLWRTTAGSRVVRGHIKGPAAAIARQGGWNAGRAATAAALVDPDLGGVEDVLVCDWGTDPWAGGGYSVPVVGVDAAARRWAEPLAGVVFFAGEACGDPEVRGLVQGALTSGRRAAREILGRDAHA
ncbi:NAD(P)/FAD-dependent oxidoreductase [Actinopolymorpha pittospori]